ncbi:MAG TPA: hypothetical protein VFC99_06080 [Acidimicrobiia bacterium]|nr:hypothetical protein [Acidimicrobiia bacterium]
MRLDLASVMLQWAAGGLLFGWVTTRRREVGIGYGWLLRASFGVIAAIGVGAGIANDDHGTGATVRDVFGIAMIAAAAVALAVSVARRRAGVSGQRARREARAGRVAAMLRQGDAAAAAGDGHGHGNGTGDGAGDRGAEFPPVLDLVAPVLGAIALLGAAGAAGGPYALAAGRLLVGAAFLGVITDAMLLGHWYLVQPGLARDPIRELVRWSAWIWPFEVALLLVPTGMGSVLDGSIDDGYQGLIGYMWIVCALTTIALVGVTWLALRERYYSAVMAATGLLYLAILTAFGTDVMARAVLAT